MSVSGEKTTVVFYEPMLSICQLFGRALSMREDLELLGATSDRDRAVELAAKYRPRSALLSGYGTCEADGTSEAGDLSVLCAIRQELPSVLTVVLSTADGTRHEINEADWIRAGADKVLSKGMSLERIFSELRTDRSQLP